MYTIFLHGVTAIAIPTLTPRQISNSTDNSSTAAEDIAESRYEPTWVAGPGTRGTLSLVFSCVITLFLCVWTTVHVNIEPPSSEYNHTLFRALPGIVQGWIVKRKALHEGLGRLLASRNVRKTGWGVVTLVAPEGAMAIATYERKTAMLLRDGINKLREKIKKREEGKGEGLDNNNREGMWDLTMAYYGVMGGFVISRADYDASLDEEDGVMADVEAGLGTAMSNEIEEEVKEISKAEASGTTSNEEGTSKVAVKTTTSTDNIKAVKKPPANKPLTLTPNGILLLACWDKLPSITTEEVRDKSNANSLAKAIVFWQTLWMIVEVIGRAASALPVTLLELHVCLHAFCAAVMYGTWWDKPVDIDLPTEVKNLTRDQIRHLVYGRIARTEDDPTDPLNAPKKDLADFLHTLASEPSSLEPGTGAAERTISPFLTSRCGLGKLMYRALCGHPNGSSTTTTTTFFSMYFSLLGTAYSRLWKGRKNVNGEGLAISLVGLVYGGVHLTAWNNEFPTFAEQMLWKVSSAVTAAAWSVFVVSLWLSVLLDFNIMTETGTESKRGRLRKRVFSSACGVFFGVGLVPVVLVRLYLLVESFASLRLLPKGSYVLLRWSEAWPHAS